MKLVLDRFIPGRPNPITIPINPVNFENSLHYQSGADLNFKTKQIDLWTYTENYPPQLDVDC